MKRRALINGQRASKGSADLADGCKLGFTAIGQGLIQAGAGNACLSCHFGHAHRTGSGIQGVDKFLRRSFNGILKEYSYIFLGFKMIGYIKRLCFKWHGLNLQLPQKFFRFGDVFFLARFIASGKKKYDLTSLDGVIHPKSGTKKTYEVQKGWR
jgi:hypothetical protein